MPSNYTTINPRDGDEVRNDNDGGKGRDSTWSSQQQQQQVGRRWWDWIATFLLATNLLTQ